MFIPLCELKNSLLFKVVFDKSHFHGFIGSCLLCLSSSYSRVLQRCLQQPWAVFLLTPSGGSCHPAALMCGCAVGEVRTPPYQSKVFLQVLKKKVKGLFWRAVDFKFDTWLWRALKYWCFNTPIPKLWNTATHSVAFGFNTWRSRVDHSTVSLARESVGT